MALNIDTAILDDARDIADMQTRVADDLTRLHGIGHWSAHVTEDSVLRAISSSTVRVARDDGMIVATFRLVTKRPWAIDPAYFTSVSRPAYLLSMAVEPERQRTGIGRRLLADARLVAASRRAHAIRLDAYDSPAGAGSFYVSCGYTEVGRAVYRGVPLIYYELLLP